MAIQIITLAFGIGAMIATMKLLNIHLNLLNVLSFRLRARHRRGLGIYVVLVWQKTQDIQHDVAGCSETGLARRAGQRSAVSGRSLLRENPALTGLGIACAIGIFWSLIATISSLTCNGGG